MPLPITFGSISTSRPSHHSHPLEHPKLGCCTQASQPCDGHTSSKTLDPAPQNHSTWELFTPCTPSAPALCATYCPYSQITASRKENVLLSVQQWEPQPVGKAKWNRGRTRAPPGSCHHLKANVLHPLRAAWNASVTFILSFSQLFHPFHFIYDTHSSGHMQADTWRQVVRGASKGIFKNNNKWK